MAQEELDTFRPHLSFSPEKTIWHVYKRVIRQMKGPTQGSSIIIGKPRLMLQEATALLFDLWTALRQFP